MVPPWRLWKCVPRCRLWGLCGSHPIHVGQDPVHTETTCLLLTCSVSCLLRDSQRVNCGCCLINLRSFFFLSSCRIHMRSGTLGGLLLCVLLSENLWRCHINIIAYHMLIHGVTTVWFPLDRAQIVLFFLIFIFTLSYFTILYWFCHTLT